MGKYGQTAIRATGLIITKAFTPLDAWRVIAAEEFVGAPQSMKKVCPREAFLGLCDAGVLHGVAPESSTPQFLPPNRSYAVKAVDLLLQSPSLAAQGRSVLWRRVLTELGADRHKSHNQQMDVVLSLWAAGHVKGGPSNHSLAAAKAYRRGRTMPWLWRAALSTRQRTMLALRPHMLSAGRPSASAAIR